LRELDKSELQNLRPFKKKIILDAFRTLQIAYKDKLKGYKALLKHSSREERSQA